MRNRSMLILSILFASTMGCARTALLQPSDLSPKLAEMNANNPFASKDRRQRVEYPVVGMEKYDQFFEQVAHMKGAVLLARYILQDTRLKLRELALSAGIKPVVKPGDDETEQLMSEIATRKEQGTLPERQFEVLREGAGRIEALVDVMQKVPEQAKTLGVTAKELVQSAPSDFKGLSALKLPGVTKGLKESAVTTNDAASTAPRLIKDLGQLTKTLISAGRK